MTRYDPNIRAAGLYDCGLRNVLGAKNKPAQWLLPELGGFQFTDLSNQTSGCFQRSDD